MDITLVCVRGTFMLGRACLDRSENSIPADPTHTSISKLVQSHCPSQLLGSIEECCRCLGLLLCVQESLRLPIDPDASVWLDTVVLLAMLFFLRIITYYVLRVKTEDRGAIGGARARK